MGEAISDLRRWLKEVQPPAARLLAEYNEVLRNLTHLARMTAGRRAATVIRVWASRASTRELQAVAACASVEASKLLSARGWPDEVLAQPDEAQLRSIMTELEPPLAELALYGLLTGEFAATPLAWKGRATLFAAAATPVARTAEEGAHGLDADGGGGPASDEADEDLAAIGVLVADAAEAEMRMLDAVTGGPDIDLAAAITRHEEANAQVRERLGDVGLRWSAHQGLGQATALVEAEAARRKAARQESVSDDRYRQLSQTRQVLVDTLERGETTPQARIVIEKKIEDLEAELAELPQPEADLAIITDELTATPTPTPTPIEEALPGPDETPQAPPTLEPAPAPDLEPQVVERTVSLPIPDPAPSDAIADPPPKSAGTAKPTSAKPPAPAPILNDTVSIGTRLAQFVSAGRLDEAHFLARAHEGPDGACTAALAYAAAAFRCRDRDVSQANMIAVAFDADWQATRFRNDPVADALVVVAAIRLGAVIGWAPAALAGRTAPADEPWWRLVDKAADVIRRGESFTAGPGGTAEERAMRKARLRGEAAQLSQELPMRTVKLQRATSVLRYLARPGSGIAGRVLQAVVDWIDGALPTDGLLEVVGEFRAVPALTHITLADHALSRIEKEPITAGALQRLEQHLEEVGLIAATAAGIAEAEGRARPDDTDAVRDLYRMIKELEDKDPPEGPEGPALALLRDWMVKGSHGTGLPDDSDPLRADAAPLLAATGLARSHAGAPDLDAPGTVPVLVGLLEDQSVGTLVAAYNERGDIGLSRALLAAARAGRVPAVPPPLAKEAAELARETVAAETRWIRLCEDSYHRARDSHARVWSMRSRPGTESVESPDSHAARLEVLASPPSDRAFGRVRAELEAITAELRSRLEDQVKRLRSDLENMSARLIPEDQSRIEALLDRRDIVAATELLVLAGQEARLPVAEKDSGDHLRDFIRLVERAAADKDRDSKGPRWYAQQAGGARAGEEVQEALTGWDELARPGQEQRLLPKVLRLLGLDCNARDVSFIHDRLPTGIRRLRVTCRPPHDGYVATFGSSAPGAFTVVLVTNPGTAVNPAKVVADWVQDEPTLVLCFRPVPPAGWRQLLASARTRSHQALVVDPAVVGWVAARAPLSFRGLQQVTLPWTGRNPYTPFAAGLVPPEIFHGRTAEMEGIKDPFGPLFVYGGRQLGKSAMLHRVADDFTRKDTRFAVYIDLKAEGIGDIKPPEHIWVALAKALRSHGVLSNRTSDTAGADVIADQISRWLKADAARRLLVLADESDAFMTTDHRDSPPFRTVDKIKGLIEDTNRRFKIVFAGLHQVQRFVSLSNVPLAHGGEPIRVGPLDAATARRLVVEPLAAVGYVFDDDDRLVWRILAHTNCQASLIQIFCDQLVRELAAQGGDSLPVTVTDAAVDRTAAAVRPVIAQRLRYTINLQDRYRVLMLVLALRGVAEGYTRGYELPDLLSEARRYWEEGFEHMTTADLQITMEEMIGLGVVLRHGEGYSVRSPNLVAMLGSQDQLERELTETSFDSPYEYDPNVARRVLSSTRGRRQFSPLTERQMARTVRPGQWLVAATQEQGADRVRDALRSFAESKDLGFDWCAIDRLGARVTELSRRATRPILGVDGRGAEAPALAEALHQLEKYATAKGKGADPTTVLLVDPWQARLPEFADLIPIRPTRWTAESLRSWPDCPATDAAERRLVIEATGGWYDHVEQVVHRAELGTPLEKAVEGWVDATSSAAVARQHLDRAGVDRTVLKALRAWVSYLDNPEHIAEADLEDILDSSASVIRAMDDLGLLDRDDSGVSLNATTFRAVKALDDER